MVFTTDGSSHRNGVKCEKDAVATLNASSPEIITARHGTDVTFKHVGGTQTVTDINIHNNDGEEVSSISIKRFTAGTFDYINTSKIHDYLDDPTPAIKKLEELRKTYWKDESKVAEVRKTKESELNALLETVTSESISSLLQKVHNRCPEFILIHEMKTNTLHTFSHDSIDELSKFPTDTSTTYKLKKTRAKTSRQIWRVTNGVEVNTTLRLRLELNNGVTALLGLSKSNTNSNIVFKVQQDSVRKLITMLNARL
jgi:hypothetical protein